MSADPLIEDSQLDLEINRPDVVAEVQAAFRAYEAALMERDLNGMASSFSEHPDVVRFGIADRQRGPAELARWRAAQPAVPDGRTLTETTITTFGSGFAVVSTLFAYPGSPLVGRQSQTWVRGERWKIVQAHVSEVAGP